MCHVSSHKIGSSSYVHLPTLHAHCTLHTQCTRVGALRYITTRTYRDRQTIYYLQTHTAVSCATFHTREDQAVNVIIIMEATTQTFSTQPIKRPSPLCSSGYLCLLTRQDLSQSRKLAPFPLETPTEHLRPSYIYHREQPDRPKYIPWQRRRKLLTMPSS